MTNPVQPQACEILSVKKESRHEWTFRVATDAKPAHGQFMQLSIPMIRRGPHLRVRPGRRVAGVHHPLRG